MNRATSATFTVTEPEVLEISFTDSYTGCGGEGDWSVTAIIEGGVPPYTYSWNTGAATATITGVAPGRYMVVAEDANGCRIIGNHTTTAIVPMVVSATVTQAVCSDDCVGSIELGIEGGTAPYDIVWNTGATEALLTNLCPDIYMVSVIDQKGCEYIQEFTITNPAAIAVDLGEDVTLCLGQSHTIDITTDIPNASYVWESSNGFSSTAAEVTLTEAGVYTASIITEGNCMGSDTIEIFSSAAGINAQFLVTSQAFAQEQIVIVNTSNPIPEDSDWFLPLDAEVMEVTDDLIVIQFEQSGTYQVTLRTYQGDCFEDYTKTIIVEEARALPSMSLEDSGSQLIEEFILYPNPNSGQFTAKVALGSEAPISLKVFGAVNGIMYDDRELEGYSEYEEAYQMNLATGTYILLLQTPNGSQIRRIIIE